MLARVVVKRGEIKTLRRLKGNATELNFSLFIGVVASGVRLFAFLWCLGLLAGAGWSSPVSAATTRVLIISGLSGDQKESDRLGDLRQRFASEFAARGIPAANIEAAGDLKRADILAKLAGESAVLGDGDAFWLILLGHSAERDDGPVFEVSGPRLTAADLKTALAAIRTRQHIVITTEGSGAFIQDLAAPNRIILTATEPSGEINETIFPTALADALQDPQNRSFIQLARAAAKNVHQYYEQNGLVLTEHSMLSDPSQPAPLVEPFDKATGALLADDAAFPAPAPAPPMAADQDTLPGTPPPADKTVARQPATPETLAIMKAAQAGAAHADGSPVLILDKDVNCLVNSDQSQVVTTHQQILVENAAGTHWGDVEFSSLPPLEQITVEKARTIFPDGTYLVAGVDRRDGFTSGDYLAKKEMVLRMPAVAPGCVIEYTVRDERSPDAAISGVYQEMTVTEEVPIVTCHFTLRLPKDQSIQYRVRNLPGQPVVEQTAYSQVHTWTWSDLSAVQHLPFDPPLREVEGLVMISSYKTWKDFAAWYHRIAAGSDVAGDGVKKRSAEVTAGLKTDRDKLRALFEDVSKIRYAAIEIGVGAFRPHTAEWVLDNNYGDCKDKANLLLALARQAGIPGKFVLLNRTSSTDRTFPGFQFNHALAYFPTIDGGLWLDATDEITTFGQLPPGDVGRDGLLMDDDPTFATIPVPPAQATQLMEHLVIDPSGKSPGRLTVATRGMADYNMRSALRTLTAGQSDTFLRRELGRVVPGATLRSYTLSDLDRLEEPAHLECVFDTLPELGTEIARLTPLPMDLLAAVATPERKVALVLNDGQPFAIEETLDFTGTVAASAPPKSDFSAPGATASVSYGAPGQPYRRTLKIDVTQPTVAPSDYPAFREMMQKVFAAIVNAPVPVP
jgi:hypothetical protein